MVLSLPPPMYWIGTLSSPQLSVSRSTTKSSYQSLWLTNRANTWRPCCKFASKRMLICQISERGRCNWNTINSTKSYRLAAAACCRRKTCTYLSYTHGWMRSPPGSSSSWTTQTLRSLNAAACLVGTAPGPASDV